MLDSKTKSCGDSLVESKPTSPVEFKKLTGNYYFKPSIFGLIMMVECNFEYDGRKETTFVKATYTDIFRLGLTIVPKM